LKHQNVAKAGLSRTTIYECVKRKLYHASVTLGLAGLLGWHPRCAWMASRPMSFGARVLVSDGCSERNIGALDLRAVWHCDSYQLDRQPQSRMMAHGHRRSQAHQMRQPCSQYQQRPSALVAVTRKATSLPREICRVSLRRLRPSRGGLTARQKSAEGVVDAMRRTKARLSLPSLSFVVVIG
jgi:hypothetical protein